MEYQRPLMILRERRKELRRYSRESSYSSNR
nr:MAG TPA: hypothetical protein [Caudoviricetes sp.]DAU58248.1 MAG TPA: hypothetical protein [Caudoviricetes sp.]